MKIGQILLENAPFYEHKSQRLDALHLQPEHPVTLWVITDTNVPDWYSEIQPTGVQILHLYGPATLPPALLRGLPLNYVATGEPRTGGLPWRRVRRPAGRALPYGLSAVPEAVDAGYFLEPVRDHSEKTSHLIGTLTRGREVAEMADATRGRLARFRDDLEWRIFSSPPSPGELASVDVWVDPGYDEMDLSGWVSEALVSGVTVVAARTRVNQERLLGGEAGFLVPARDPNELAHAIAAALFKPELAEPRRSVGLQKRERFRAEHRMRELVKLYSRLAA